MQRARAADRRVQHGQDREHRRSRARCRTRPATACSRSSASRPSGSRRPSSATARDRAATRHGRASGPVPFPGALHLWESEYLLRHPPTPAAPWTVITTVREPIAQAVSAFFHGRGLRGDGATTGRTIEALDRRRSSTRVGSARRCAGSTGSSRRRSASTCSSIRSTPTAGHAVIETPAVRVLLLRQENLAAAPDALGDFLGLRRAGAGARPQRGDAPRATRRRYRDFLATARLPATRARRGVRLSLRAALLCR